MRIISGTYGGRTIKAPHGRDTRPTTDRVRESIISSLISRTGGLDGANVLDPFAGSGALGIECLSRGASSCTFCDVSKRACSALRDNIDALGITADRARLFERDVLRSGFPRAEAPYDVVLLDPPYSTPAEEVLDAIRKAIDIDTISAHCLIMYETSKDRSDATADAASDRGFEVLSHKAYGATCVDILEAASQR